MHKLLKLVAITGILALSVPAFSQAVEIHVRPPHPRHEVRISMPHAGMVWQSGYHRWDDDAKSYTWTPGVWVDAPHPHAHWVAPKYMHRHDHWEFQEGHWK